jgi:hypothetical protein
MNDNSYKIDLSSEYDVCATFNFFDIFLFDVGDDSSRSTHHKGSIRDVNWANHKVKGQETKRGV